MAIKMRVNLNAKSECCNCNTTWNNTAEMYDMRIGNTTLTLCRKCTEKIFQKTLRASCIFNSKVKSKQDQARISREMLYDGTVQSGSGLSIVEALRGIKAED